LSKDKDKDKDKNKNIDSIKSNSNSNTNAENIKLLKELKQLRNENSKLRDNLTNETTAKKSLIKDIEKLSDAVKKLKGENDKTMLSLKGEKNKNIKLQACLGELVEQVNN